MKKCAARPCASCPYRQDVPSGIWSEHEYDKLPAYDGEMAVQAVNGGFSAFMCHQRNGNLCAGWVATHGANNLLALRLQAVDASVFEYTTDVPVFSSGIEARAHGLRDIAKPGKKARRLMAKLLEKGKADFNEEEEDE
jgi:hypothetical protein